MSIRILVGTSEGLRELGATERVHLAGHAVTALAFEGRRVWALLDGRTVWRADGDGTWRAEATVAGAEATCLMPTAAGLLVGTAGARLLRLAGGALVPIEAFETVDGREAWHTPWGDPPDTRSLAADARGAIYANVHVGGVVRSTDDGRSWHPTLDIDTDVHQVVTDPARPGRVLAAAAVGLAVSEDGGETWRIETAGLHARYCRAVAPAGRVELLTASTGPRGKRAAVYRREVGGVAFERCRAGLPEWFEATIDTYCLAAAGETVVFGTEDGRLYRSSDAGASWELAVKGLPEIACVALA